jgi:hypothetical protein
MWSFRLLLRTHGICFVYWLLENGVVNHLTVAECFEVAGRTTAFRT